MLIMKKKTKKSYISYIDWSVVCIYPLLRSHVVERSCEQNKHDCKQCFCTRSIKNAPYTQGVKLTQWLLASKSLYHHLLIAHISESGSPLIASLVWRGTKRKEEKGEKHEEMHRGRKIATGSRRTLLVLWGSLPRLTGQWWDTWDTGVSQMAEDLGTSHLPAGCDATHLANNTLLRPPKCIVSI